MLTDPGGLKEIQEQLQIQQLSDAFVFPRYFEIETVRACNADCEMCTVREWKNKNQRMSDVLFAKIAEELPKHAAWIRVICLSRNGEPLLDKRLPERIKLLKSIGIRSTSFSTNASLLDEKRSRALLEAGLDDIRFSIDGATKETFEKIRRGLSFEKIRDNCLRFIELRNATRAPTRIQVRMAVSASNQHEVDAWRTFWRARLSENDVVYSKPIHTWGNQLQGIEAANEIAKYAAVPCISPWSTMIIHYDGSVPLCGCDYNNQYHFGNVTERSIAEIWQSQGFAEVRQKHAGGERNDIALCRGCNIWDSKIKEVHA